MSSMPSEAEREAEHFAASPEHWSRPGAVLAGAEASAYGRSVLESAGVDLDALSRRVGRPHLGEQGTPGQRSPRVNVSLTPEIARQLDRLTSDGRTRSDIVRDALAAYLAAHGNTAPTIPTP